VPGLRAKTYDLYSPDKKIRVSIQVGSEVSYSVFVDGRELVVPSPVSLTLEGAGTLGKNLRLSGIKMRSAENLFSPVVKEKRAEVANRFNEAVLDFRGHYGLIFRAYNDGVAYRFLTRFKDTIKVVSEEVRFTFAEDHSIFIPFVESFLSSYERNYSHAPSAR
jgi:alpha-glucosidase